ncbi:MAG: DUF4390 domain-containing protein [Pseudomonadota bacterium]
MCPSPRSHRRILLWLCALLLAWPLALHAEPKTGDPQPRISAKTLEFGGGLELTLPRKVDEAVNKGIPFEIVIEVRLYRERGLLWNETIGSWQRRRELRYHALSGQFLVREIGAKPEQQESFATLPEAMRALVSLVELRLPLERELPADGYQYLARVRAWLDIESLPTPLRPRAYTSLDWHLGTGWGTWKVAR